MRSYDPADKYDQEAAERLGAPQWMLDLLSLNPSYVFWGPYEDYMMKKGKGWDSRIVLDTWDELRKDWSLDELNECVNFYFKVHREREECPCGGEGYNPETAEISRTFYDHDGFVMFDHRGLGEVSEDRILASLPPGKWTYHYGRDPDGNPAERPPWKILGKCDSWQDDLTQDEVDALLKAGRLREMTHEWDRERSMWVVKEHPLRPTPEDMRHYMHDAINRGILIRTRAERLGVWGLCEECQGHGFRYTEPECHLSLVLWWLHPRKGCSRGIHVKDVPQEKLPEVFEFLAEAAERNAGRFRAALDRGSEPVDHTNRGFGIYGRLTDTKGSEVRVQESSSVGRPCAWIFANSPDPNYENPSPHLSVENAKELIGMLQRFVRHAGSDTNWRNSDEYKEQYG